MKNIIIEKYSNNKIKKITLLYNDGINPERYIEEFDKNGFTTRIIKHYPDCKEYNITITEKDNITIADNNIIEKRGKNSYQYIILIDCNIIISNCCNNFAFKIYDFDSGNITYYKEGKKYLLIETYYDDPEVIFGESLKNNNKCYYYDSGKKYKVVLHGGIILIYDNNEDVIELKYDNGVHVFSYINYNNAYYKNNKPLLKI